jgi:hypothetical protein
MAKPKRTSNIVKYCSLHGKFVGYGWGGHRRRCQAKEVAGAEGTRFVPTFPNLKLSEKPLQKGRNVGTSNAGTTAEKVISDVKNHLFDLDTEIARLAKECEETQQLHAKKTQALADARGERDEIVRGLKQMI